MRNVRSFRLLLRLVATMVLERYLSDDLSTALPIACWCTLVLKMAHTQSALRHSILEVINRSSALDV